MTKPNPHLGGPSVVREEHYFLQRLFVSNLSWDVNDRELRELFAQVVPIQNAYVVCCHEPRISAAGKCSKCRQMAEAHPEHGCERKAGADNCSCPSRGIGFVLVKLSRPEDDAWKMLEGHEHRGRMLVVQPAQDRT